MCFGWEQFISEDGEAMIEEVRLLLAETIAFLEEVVPGLPELGLVRDAAASLDELFLVVVHPLSYFSPFYPFPPLCVELGYAGPAVHTMC